jgi:outer membrane receptor protein involved in Fe transport
MLKAFGPKKNNVIYDPSRPVCTGLNTPAGCQAAGFRPYVATTDAYNYQAVNYLITPSQRISLFANGEYRLNDNARAYMQGSFVNRQSSNLLAPEPLDLAGLGLSLSAQNAYNPFNQDLSGVRKRLTTADGRSAMQDIDTFRVVTGVDGTLPDEFGPAKGFFYDVSFNYGRTVGTVLTHGSVNGLKVAQAVGPSFVDPATGKLSCGTTATGPIAGCVPANLFGLGTPTGAQLASLGAEDLVNKGFNQQVIAQANLSGELFKLASDRPVGLAVGYEFHRELGGVQPDSTATQSFTNPKGLRVFVDSDYGSSPTRGAYNVNEGYGELNVPLISNMPFIDDLEVTGAIRAFRYSTFGSDYTYKIGARYRPIRDVTFRTTYSTAYRAPSIPELFGGRAPSAELASDPCSSPANATVAAQCGVAANNGDGNTQINSDTGGNTSLQPETAQSFTGGVVLEPQMVRGFSVTADYFWVKVKNTIVGGNLTPNYLNACYPGEGKTPNPDACAHIHRDPSTQIISVVDDYQRNFGTLITSGIDLAVRYTIGTDYGRFGILGDATILLRYDQTMYELIKGAGNYDLGVNPRLKFNAGVNYGIEGLNVGLLAHFIGAYTECSDADGTNSGGACYQGNLDANGNPYPTHRVSQQTTFDAFASYLFRNPLGNTTISAGVRNLLNKDPTRVYGSFLTYADPSAYDFVGRYFYGRVSHAF